MISTAGQILINDALPPDMRDYSRVLDGKELSSLLRQLAQQHPDKYREVTHRLSQLGASSAREQGGLSFGAEHLRKSDAVRKLQEEIKREVSTILRDPKLTDKQKNERIIVAVGSRAKEQENLVYEEAKKAGNPLAMQVASGARGKPANLASLLGGDLLYTDHRNNVIPIPVLRSYSQGLSPAEYYAGTYGARKGIVDVKQATADSGYLSKQLSAAVHRLVIAGKDSDDYDPETPRGLIVDTDDIDNEGALLAKDFGPYKRNTPLTPKILSDLRAKGFDQILVRSPIIGGSPEGGVYAYDVGVREDGRLPTRGEFVGIQSANALGEPLSQGMLSSKHTGGVAGQSATTTGFAAINALVQVPQKMPTGATHATADGHVEAIEEAPAGGHYITIAGTQHYVPVSRKISVRKGDVVEAGDVLSDGLPSPAVVTEYKGLGEGRRYFTEVFRKAMKDSGINAHRRNVELLARGMLNHVQLTEETENHVPDDVVPYSTIEHRYQPRPGHTLLDPSNAEGKYLERPVLHYTIGTKLRPSVIKNLQKFGVKSIPVHDEPPPFQPHMVRGMYQMQNDPDFLTQMYGSGLKKSLLDSTARGATSQLAGSSFVPSLASTTDFGLNPTRMIFKAEPRKPLSAELELPADPSIKQADNQPGSSTLPATPTAPSSPAPSDTDGGSSPITSISQSVTGGKAPAAPRGANFSLTPDPSPSPTTNSAALPAPNTGFADNTPPPIGRMNGVPLEQVNAPTSLSWGQAATEFGSGLGQSALGMPSQLSHLAGWAAIPDYLSGYRDPKPFTLAPPKSFLSRASTRALRSVANMTNNPISRFASRSFTPLMVAADGASTVDNIANLGWEGTTTQYSDQTYQNVKNLKDYERPVNMLAGAGGLLAQSFSPVSAVQAAAGTATIADDALTVAVTESLRKGQLDSQLAKVQPQLRQRDQQNRDDAQLKEIWAKGLTKRQGIMHTLQRPGEYVSYRGRQIVPGSEQSTGGPQYAPGIPSMSEFQTDGRFDPMKFDDWVERTQAASGDRKGSAWYNDYQKALANNKPAEYSSTNAVHSIPLRDSGVVQQENAAKMQALGNAARVTGRAGLDSIRSGQAGAQALADMVPRLHQLGVRLPRL